MKLKVKALSVGGLGKKIHTAGEIVTEDHFPRGNAEKLIASGHLEVVPEEPAADQKKSKKVEVSVKSDAELTGEETNLEKEESAEDTAGKKSGAGKK